jgi:integrase
MQALLFACRLDAGAGGRRDAAIVALMSAGGLTPADFAGLRWSDLDEERALLFVHRRDAGRALIIDDNPGLTLLLSEWKQAAETSDGPMFPVMAGLRSTQRALSPAGAAAVVRRRAGAAGIPRLRASDLNGAYWNDVGRRAERGERPCSLLVLEEGSCWLGSVALDLPVD